jgi:hypothetical protein
LKSKYYIRDHTAGAERLVIDTNGFVGIGTTNPGNRLSVLSGVPGSSAIYGVSETGRGVWGKSTSSAGTFGESNSFRGVWGKSNTGSGVYGFSASQIGVLGESNGFDGVSGMSHKNTAAGVSGHNDAGGWAMYADNNTGQARDKGGWVKAMVYVEGGTITRCFNSQRADGGASVPRCGFNSDYFGGGSYNVDFDFQIEDRFISLTPHQSGAAAAVANFRFSNPNRLVVTISVDADPAQSSFMVIIY